MPNSAQANEALAAEIDQIRESLIAYANTKYLDRPVFGGTTAGAAAYDSRRHLRRRRRARPTRTVGAGSKVRVDTTGPEAFGDAVDTQLFTVLKSHLRQHRVRRHARKLTDGPE